MRANKMGDMNKGEVGSIHNTFATYGDNVYYFKRKFIDVSLITES